MSNCLKLYKVEECTYAGDYAHSVHWGINPPSETPPSFFLPSPPLKSEELPKPLLLGNPPPLYCFFVNTPKNQSFSEPQKY